MQNELGAKIRHGIILDEVSYAFFFYQNKSMFSSSVFTGEFCALKFHLLSFRTTLLSAWQSYSHCCLELFKEMPPCHNNLI
mmetsp:Transcript_27980/g.41620  ORF Transcript_27980/g.41620 Transcript_27980/m.41620 type:complete len:81 (-) Transcript_27980:242-484(-)